MPSVKTFFVQLFLFLSTAKTSMFVSSNPLFGGLLSFPTVSQWSIYRNDRTLAVVRYSSQGSDLQDCHIYDLDKHEAPAANAVTRLQGQETVPIMEIDLNQTLAIISACRNLDLKRNPKLSAALAAAESEGRGMSSSSVPVNISEILSLWRGIVPGTKWCGSGDEAADYRDIGTKAIVDSCCRSHDLCPTRLRSFRMGYGLINLSLYTKSHCRCDDEFYRCLKSSQSTLGDVLGNFYFNIMKFGCMEDVPPEEYETLCRIQASSPLCFNSASSPLQTMGGRTFQGLPSRYRFRYNRDIIY